MALISFTERSSSRPGAYIIQCLSDLPRGQRQDRVHRREKNYYIIVRIDSAQVIGCGSRFVLEALAFLGHMTSSRVVVIGTSVYLDILRGIRPRRCSEIHEDLQ